ncbi:uncharacterized protein LOC123562779 [Mercenaria mercenaria]|uniref:uncharacterized protein LOC123562779 n=1 Tax=Mercenaria mercenaria TaxID=6596 RepID=UPI00234F23A3|nr:uncharacterized protein LOC123562779 [Mercenaria mercenaria]
MTGICTRNTRNLNAVVIQFFEMVPVRRIQWPNGEIDVEDLDMEAQSYVLSKTVNSDLCRQYPPSIQYQRAFVKKLLTTLEGYSVEMCDELYETYTGLLQHRDSEEDTLCYKTYTVGEDVKITVQESVNMISFGTTGLSTWQAAQHLAEWAIQNKQLFEDRHVIELGCGLGLTGLTVCKQCRVNTYTFTDCHTQVLDLLAQNINHNFSDHIHAQTYEEEISKGICELNLHKCGNQSSLNCDKTDCDAENICDTRSSLDCDRTSFGSADCNLTSAKNDSSLLNDSDCVTIESDTVPELTETVDHDGLIDCGKTLICNGDVTSDQWTGVKEYRIDKSSFCKCIQLARFDWEDIDHKLVKQLAGTDVVLAADVVYDTRIIPALVSVLKLFLGNGPTCTAYIASTIRNEDTRDQFLISLSNEGLKYEQVDPPTLQLFHYDRSVPIEIIRIKAVS